MTGRLGRFAAEEAVIISYAPQRGHWSGHLLRAAASLTVPVIAFVVMLFLAWDLRWIPLTLFDGILSPPGRPELYPSTWLTVGHAAVAGIFLVTNLVNRRFGDSYALAFVIVGWGLASLIALAMMMRADPDVAVLAGVPSLRVTIAFLGAMVLAQILGVFVFDRTRGVVWWKAPLYSALASSFAIAFLFYPMAYLGSDVNWLNQMSVDAGVKAAMSFVLLLPYMALRQFVRPMGGFGGF